MSEQAELREQVRAGYAAAALKVTQGGTACCGPGEVEVDESFGAGLYATEETGSLPAEALAASLGCGNPLAVADLREGERVLDLGSGGGIDVLLSARRVGPAGRAYGLDMTEEMLALARANANRAAATNVDFLKGAIEDIPLPADSIDVVISNCVINLSVDKPAVFAEMFRVLTPGGRIGISDVVADDTLTSVQRAERGGYVGCIAGALSFAEYREGLATAGFTRIEVTPTHQVTDGMHSAIVRAAKPTTVPLTLEPVAAVQAGSCCGVTACCTPAETAADPGEGTASPASTGRTLEPDKNGV
ncbi:arsenite methyltransferase [Streptomyces sp. NPDC051940]|uniref:arsenite methyltransferase n=1 Tax=Streptomyces sp. NPDC051940 TaxID=3155675 RepID=UPI00343BA56A